METSFELFARRIGPRGWVSRIICTSMSVSAFIAPVKPAMFRFPDSFTAVSELKRAFQEAWRIMVRYAGFISMKCYEGRMALATRVRRK